MYISNKQRLGYYGMSITTTLPTTYYYYSITTTLPTIRVTGIKRKANVHSFLSSSLK